MKFGKVSLTKANTKRILKFMEITSKKELKILIDWIKYAHMTKSLAPCNKKRLIINNKRYCFFTYHIEKLDEVGMHIAFSFYLLKNYSFHNLLYWIRESKDNLNQLIKWIKEIYENN